MNKTINEMKPLRTSPSLKELQHAIKPLDSIAAVVYTSEQSGWFLARGYTRKSRNFAFNYRFATADKRSSYVAKWVKNLVNREERKKQDRAARFAKHTLEVGDVVNTSWGYNQTQCEFYQVVGLKAKTMVHLREIAQKHTDDAHVVPVLNKFVGEQFSKRVNPTYNSIKISESRRATPTSKDDNGNFAPSYVTAYGCGH